MGGQRPDEQVEKDPKTVKQKEERLNKNTHEHTEQTDGGVRGGQRWLGPRAAGQHQRCRNRTTALTLAAPPLPKAPPRPAAPHPSPIHHRPALIGQRKTERPRREETTYAHQCAKEKEGKKREKKGRKQKGKKEKKKAAVETVTCRGRFRNWGSVLSLKLCVSAISVWISAMSI
eukprot:3940880-Rhodomonas_salina.4